MVTIFLPLLLHNIASNKVAAVNIRLTLPGIEGRKAGNNILYKERRYLDSRFFKLFVKFIFCQSVHLSEIEKPAIKKICFR